jgi:protein-S-isoprenylcysteine O-methyltransferase Ste14
VAGVALVLWLLYYTLTFGLRVILQWRRTAATGLVWLRGPPLSPQWLGEALELIALTLGVAAPALVAADRVEPIAALDGTGAHVAGVALFLLGTAGVVASQRAMGSSWRVGVDPSETTELVTEGPFAMVRNPIFTSLVAVQAGVALMVPTLLAFAGVLLMVVSIEIQARFAEEPYLARIHGDRYLRYASQVGRFVPRVGRYYP